MPNLGGAIAREFSAARSGARPVWCRCGTAAACVRWRRQASRICGGCGFSWSEILARTVKRIRRPRPVSFVLKSPPRGQAVAVAGRWINQGNFAGRKMPAEKTQSSSSLARGFKRRQAPRTAAEIKPGAQPQAVQRRNRIRAADVFGDCRHVDDVFMLNLQSSGG